MWARCLQEAATHPGAQRQPEQSGAGLPEDTELVRGKFKEASRLGDCLCVADPSHPHRPMRHSTVVKSWGLRARTPGFKLLSHDQNLNSPSLSFSITNSEMLMVPTSLLLRPCHTQSYSEAALCTPEVTMWDRAPPPPGTSAKCTPTPKASSHLSILFPLRSGAVPRATGGHCGQLGGGRQAGAARGWGTFGLWGRNYRGLSKQELKLKHRAWC